MDVQNTDALPLEPFMRDGAEAQPLYELTGLVTKEDFGQFNAATAEHSGKKTIRNFRGTGVATLVVGVMALWLDERISFAMFLMGGFYLYWSFIYVSNSAKTAARLWDGSQAFLCRFFEEGFEYSKNREMARRAYSDISEMIYRRGHLYLYVGKIRAYILPQEALGDQAQALIAFLEGKVGKMAIRADKGRKR